MNYMKREKVLGTVLFWLTLVSPMIAFTVESELGEPEIFGVAGMIRYMWVMWLFAPIGILSVLVGLKLKRSGQRYRKNIVIACICLPLILIFGSYRFIFGSMVSYETDKVAVIEQQTGVELPDDVKVASEIQTAYTVSYVKITSEESREKFEKQIAAGGAWKHSLSTQIKGLLPINTQYEMVLFDDFLFYNVTTHEYNTCPPAGEYDCIFMAYDSARQRLLILDGYKVNMIP